MICLFEFLFCVYLSILLYFLVELLLCRTPTRKSKQYTVETGNGNGSGLGGMLSFSSPTSTAKLARSSSAPDLQPSNSNKLEAMLIRDEKLSKAETLTAKFLEAADGYHRIVKKTIEKRGHKGSGANSPPPR
jgi:hypothetical protein